MRTKYFAAILCIIMVRLPTADIANAQTTSSPRVETRVTYEYGAEIEFRATIVTQMSVRNATLKVSADHFDPLDLISQLTIENDLMATVILDLRALPLLPFTIVEYEWNIEFEDGAIFNTVTDTFEYIDNRLPWKHLKQHPITLHWVDGESVFAQNALSYAHQTLSSISRDLAIPAYNDLRIYIYPDRSWLQSAMDLSDWPSDRVLNDPPPDAIVLATSEVDNAERLIKQDLPQEIVRFVLFDLMQDDAQYLPRWLVEGMTTLNAFSPHPEYQLALESALQRDQWISLSQLCEDFPQTIEASHVAYGLSASFSRYLLERYGQNRLNQLIRSYGKDVACSAGLEQVYGQTLEQLEDEWKLNTFFLPPDRAQLDLIPWLLLFVPLFLLILAAFMPRSSSMKTTQPRGPKTNG